MDAKSKQSKRRDNILSSLNVAIEGLNVAEKISAITPAKAVFSTVSVILTMIRDSMVNEEDYVELGLACNIVCTALGRGLKGKRLGDLGDSVIKAIGQLTTTLADIRKKVAERSKQNVISRAFHAKNDSQTIASWRMDFNRFLLIFNTELGLNIFVTLSSVHDDVAKAGAVAAKTQAMVSDISDKLLESKNQTKKSGESPPPAPRTCFGRGGLINKIVGLAEQLKPIALTGPGGIGKTSIALTVLHHGRIKQRFGDNRRFIRCDQFPPSSTHLLSRLSKVIGAGIESPKNLAPLRPSLSSGKMIIVLDNAESILDPKGKDAREIYAAVEELGQLDNICLCITSRISAVPSDCEILDVPTLSIKAARDTFYHIYKKIERPDLTDKILGQLDFHPLSITLLATVAHQNRWDTDRLTREWESQRTRTLQTMGNKGFAATMELSLASPTFQELGPSARALLEVVAFFPQGVDENNFSWLFPSIPNVVNVFDKFRVLSLTHRNSSFVTMLAPLRDYLRPKNPKSSPLLCVAKEKYFTRMSVDLNPNDPSFGESRWIMSEDVNVEHLLDIFTTIDAKSDGVWDACANFMGHLARHKQRTIILSPKIEQLPDGHRSKPKCLFELSRLFESIGNQAERKRLLTHALKLWRKRGDHSSVAQTLRYLSRANRHMGLYKEGIQQVQEASEILGRLGDTAAQARCLKDLASLLQSNKQFDAAEDAASRAIGLLSKNGEQFQVCESHRLLGCIYNSKGETEKAITSFKVALGIATRFSWPNELFWAHFSLARLYFNNGKLNDAQTHVERAKLHAANYTYYLGRAMQLQARLWYEQRKFKEAKSEALRAAGVLEKLGAAQDLKGCRELLRWIEEDTKKPVVPDKSAKGGRVAKPKR